MAWRPAPLARRQVFLRSTSRVAPRVAATAVDAAASFKLYNTASGQKDVFRPRKAGQVAFYSCGPTIYDYAHIGNFRAFLTYDVVKRWLMYLGLDVEHVCNLTDIDDKIIARVARDGLSLEDLTNTFAEAFFADLEALNIVPATAYPRATEHIDDMVQLITKLMENGCAYEVDGSYYFRVDRAHKYGRMARLDFDGMQDGAAEGGGLSDSAATDAQKESARDFALWKAYKPEDGDIKWATPLGEGRPGWHIECSAMAKSFFGDTIDLHAGGIDLVFPHHENEIAQSEAATGEDFCSHWIHNGFVNINNEKMSKSKANFVTLRSLENARDVRAFRYLVVTSQYRSPLNFCDEALKGARNAVKKLDRFRDGVLEAARHGAADPEPDVEVVAAVGKAMKQFEEGMNDDLNTPRAMAGVFGLLKAVQPSINAGSLGRGSAAAVEAALADVNAVLGIFYTVPAAYFEEDDGGDVPEEVMDLVRQRTAAKDARDWGRADEIRDKIKAAGFAVKDVKGGDPVVSRL